MKDQHSGRPPVTPQMEAGWDGVNIDGYQCPLCLSQDSLQGLQMGQGEAGGHRDVSLSNCNSTRRRLVNTGQKVLRRQEDRLQAEGALGTLPGQGHRCSPPAFWMSSFQLLNHKCLEPLTVTPKFPKYFMSEVELIYLHCWLSDAARK